MFSFEGDFRPSRPQQSFAGSSQKQDRISIIRNAQIERRKREQNRLHNFSAVKIQSYVRSFLNRQKVKNRERQNFDDNIKLFGMDYDLAYLVKRIVFFYAPKCDADRLIFLCQHILKSPQGVFDRIVGGDRMWIHRLKKLLHVCMLQITDHEHSWAIPLRMLEVFTSTETTVRYMASNEPARLDYLEAVFKYLVSQGYFQTVRRLIEEKVPSLDEEDTFHSPVGEALLQMILRPLKLVQVASVAFTTVILASFSSQILSREFSEQIKFYIVPNLASNVDFPYRALVKYLAEMHLRHVEERRTTLVDIDDGLEGRRKKARRQEEPKFSTFLLYALLKLDQRHLESMNDADSVRNYIRVLAAMSDNVAKVPKKEWHLVRHHFNSSDSEDSDNEDDFPMYSAMERATLTDIVTLLNESERVIFIVQRVDWFLEETDVMLAICEICHNLMTYNQRTAIYEYKLLYMLAFKSKFIRQLWLQLTANAERRGVFQSPLSLLSRGIVIAKHEADDLVPVLVTFCALFGRLIQTLHDGEFTNENSLPGVASKIMPFTIEEIVPLSATLKDICLGLVELAYPETRSNLTEQYRTMLSSLHKSSANATSTAEVVPKNVWPHLLKVAVTLLRQLHTRDLRLNFCPEGHWTVRTLNLPLDKPTDLHITRRRGMRPFQPIRDFTREDLSEGPPLSIKQIRSITILREIPFVIDFNTRVGILQGLLAADKLRSQGDLQGFLQGPSIQLMVRRSHLYEDAFDKLSLENEPDLRPRFRVQLINAVGLEEAGIDGGGVFREFLSELIKTAFDPHRGFFMISNDNKLYPNPSVGKIVENYEKHYFFIGRILGKALYENLLVELPLAEFFLSKLAGKHSDVDVHQLASLDPVLHRNLMSLKAYEGDVADLGLDFTVVCDELGETRVEELKPNGSNITVNASNRIEYIQLMADFKLNRQIRAQCLAFRQGLANVLPIEWLYMFSNKELQVLISGAEIPVDVEDLRRNTRYGGDFNGEHPTIDIFWKVVESFTDLQKRQLLKFVTSCSRPPLLGFKELDPAFCIQNAGSTDRLPSASTCMNLLKLPAFDSEELMREKLLYAIQSGAGFELS